MSRYPNPPKMLFLVESIWSRCYPWHKLITTAVVIAALVLGNHIPLPVIPHRVDPWP